ncbi:type II secretion system F family protein [Kallotenue papyrolyticum]|uniref:type II secretion system F family protein n=1 Tax=Kallotenue papyrolyticum TaxID=1325125 RepID=UPI0004785485|nr:type II secretion system F family protein [Kallotenue papyrolyticum]
MINLLALVAAILAGSAVLLLVLGLNRLLPGSAVDERLEAYATMSMPLAPAGDGEGRPALDERLNSYLSRRGLTGRIAADLARADVRLTVIEFLLIKLLALVVPWALLWVLTGQPLTGLLLGAIGFFLPDAYVRLRRRRRSQEFALQLPDTLALIVSALRAGFSLQQAMLNVSKEAPEPTATEFRRLSQEVQLGVPLITALEGMVRRVDSPDLEMIVSVFKIHARVGGNLAQVLDTVSTTIRERVRLRREVQVITAQQRYSSYVLGVLPLALALILFVLNPDYMLGMFQWNIFLCIPVGAFTMSVIGFLVIRKIVAIKI